MGAFVAGAPDGRRAAVPVGRAICAFPGADDPVGLLPVGLVGSATGHLLRDLGDGRVGRGLDGHPALRTRLVTRDGMLPGQRIDDAPTVALPVVDLSAQPDALARAAALTDADALAPFDLVADAPLWRARVLRLGAEDHVLSVTIHHIVSDGESIELWLDAVRARYVDSVRGQAASASTPARENSPLVLPAPCHPARVAYWRDALAELPSCVLPQRADAPAVPQWRAARIAFEFDAALIRTARDAASAAHATLPMLLHAALNTALFRATGAADQPVGVLASTRELTGDAARDALGLFINSVVVRTRLDAAARRADVLAQVRDTALAAYAHADVPFADVVAALRAPRTAQANPLFQVMFSYLRPTGAAARDWAGLSLAEFDDVRHRVVFTLELDVVEHPDGRVSAAFSYADELLDGAFVDTLVRLYHDEVARFAGAPEATLGAPDARMSPAELSRAGTYFDIPASTVRAALTRAVAAGDLRREEGDAYAAARLTLHDNADGTTTGRFVIPALHAALLRKLLDTLTTPRRAHLGAAAAQHGNPGFDDPDRDAKRKGAALCEILEHLPTDRLSRGGATLLVTIDLDRLRGALGAARLETGEELWRFNTLDDPNNPEQEASWGDVPPENRWGGTPWATGSYDPKSDTLFWGVGMPGPYPEVIRGSGSGDVLYTNSTLALDAKTGKLKWYYQHLPRDNWDLDSPFERVLVDTPDGKHLLVTTAGKNGITFGLDRDTGKYLWSQDTVYQNVVDHIDADGAPPGFLRMLTHPREGEPPHLCEFARVDSRQRISVVCRAPSLHLDNDQRSAANRDDVQLPGGVSPVALEDAKSLR